jgi:uncharacterized protein (TIGR04255 family)
MTRPPQLPEYNKPPVDEVVVGVQFGSLSELSSVYFGEVWALFKSEYPTVQEQIALPPQFETFGGQVPGASFHFGFGAAPPDPRLWFISEDENHLIQFQRDRLLCNWRKRTGEGTYPRFESVLTSFENSFRVLADHAESKFNQKVRINQFEVTYFNVIPIEAYSELGSWLTFVGDVPLKIEGFASNFHEILTDSDDVPFARLYCETQTVATPDGAKKAVRFNLTVRGAPKSSELQASLELFGLARETIVNRFTELTTAHAHTIWERQR